MNCQFEVQLLTYPARKLVQVNQFNMENSPTGARRTFEKLKEKAGELIVPSSGYSVCPYCGSKLAFHARTTTICQTCRKRVFLRKEFTGTEFWAIQLICRQIPASSAILYLSSQKEKIFDLYERICKCLNKLFDLS